MASKIEFSAQQLEDLCRQYDARRTSNEGLQIEDGSTTIQYRVLDYKVTPTSDAPAGFLGLHLFLNIRYLKVDKFSDESTVEEIRFFTKSAPVHIASRMEYLENFGVFRKEIAAYRDVLPKLAAIFPGIAAHCYFADNDLLIFEDLMEEGFKMGAARDGLLDYEHLQCVLKTLAALHAGSFVYEQRHGDRSIANLQPFAVVENAYPLGVPESHVRRQNFNNAVTVMQAFVRLMPKYQSDLPFILQQLPKQMNRIFTLSQTSAKYPNVFSHGDLWANNVMFQYGRYGETPLQSRFVDFQLARYAPPMLDLITILTIPTSREFRSKYLEELSCMYYYYLNEFLKREEIDLSAILPRKMFDEGMKEFRICGLIESFLFSHLTVLPIDLTASLTTSATGFSDFFDKRRAEICLEALRTDQVYRDRITDMTEDLVDNFILSERQIREQTGRERC